jgi:hypothetical protein
MYLLDTYRINKAIAVLLSSQDAASDETTQAVETLKRLGPSAIPKLIEAIGKAHNPRTLVALLVPLVQNATLPFLGDGLASSNPRVVTGVVDVLTQASTYDSNQLLDFWLLSRDRQSSEQFARLNRRYDEMQAECALVPLTRSDTSQEEAL